MIKKAKVSGYCFYITENIQGDFQICISVPLILIRSINVTYETASYELQVMSRELHLNCKLRVIFAGIASYEL